MTGLLLIVILGVPAARVLARHASARLALGAGLLLGTALAGLILIVLTPFGWSPLAAGFAALVVGATLWRFRRPLAPTTWHPTDALTLATLTAYGVWATRPWQWAWENWAESRRDFFFIWGAKATLFLAHRGVDVTFLRNTPPDLSQPDYPWLWPLAIDWLALFHGSWDPRLAGLATVILAAGALLVFRDAAESVAPGNVAAWLTLAATGAVCTSYLGLADGPFAAFAAAALLLIDRDDLPLGATLLGISALVKNEGSALIVATVLALAFAGRMKDIRRLWPAAAIAVPWLVARRALGLSTDLFRGSAIARLGESLTHFDRFLAQFAYVYEPNPWLYLAIGFALLVSVRQLARERFLIAAVALQLASYLVANLISPFGVGAQLGGAWSRLLSHVAMPLVFVVVKATAARRADAARP